MPHCTPEPEKESYIIRLSAWAPGIGTGEWDEWALGKRSIASEGKAPDIAYTDSIFRRRLSQISRMTIQVIHDLLPLGDNVKIFFISFRGELSRVYQIFKMLIEEGTVSPAAFSLSGFNTPVALASIAFGLKGGYTALYPANNAFTAGIQAAEAALLSGTAEDIAVVYADEYIPPECSCFFRDCPPPAAFGFLLSRNSRPSSVPLSSYAAGTDDPLVFLKQLLLQGGLHVSS